MSGLTHLSGWLAYGLVGLLVFGETALFIGFVLPGETAVVLGGVLASRGHIQLWLLIVVVVVAAVTGPLVGYEIGRRMGDRIFAGRLLARIPGGVDRTRTVLRERGGLGVLVGRFVAILRALMPAAAGAAEVPYRTFVVYNMIGGVIWSVGYSLVGYLAGSAYTVIERRVGAGLAIAVAALVVAALAVWAVRRHRRERGAPDGTVPDGSVPDSTVPKGNVTEGPGMEPPATS